MMAPRWTGKDRPWLTICPLVSQIAVEKSMDYFTTWDLAVRTTVTTILSAMVARACFTSSWAMGSRCIPPPSRSQSGRYLHDYVSPLVQPDPAARGYHRGGVVLLNDKGPSTTPPARDALGTTGVDTHPSLAPKYTLRSSWLSLLLAPVFKRWGRRGERKLPSPTTFRDTSWRASPSER